MILNTRMKLTSLLLLSPLLLEPSWAFAPPALPRSSITRQHTALSTSTDINNGVSAAAADSATTTTTDAPVSMYVPKEKRSYYQILGADTNATKTELKKKYIGLARLTHPDALIGNDASAPTAAADFSEIAQAWKVLSNTKDRRRYDRSLQAEDFKNNVEQVASAVSKTAGPRVKKAFDDFAVPFLRRTTVTTVATVTAAVDKLTAKNTNPNGRGGIDLGSAVASAIKAGEAASRVVDEMEFLEKSKELEKLAAAEIEEAKKIKAQLKKVVADRLSISLSTPNSGLSSCEALDLLNGLNTVDSITVMERLSMKHTIEHDIKDLESIETDYFDQVAERTVAVENFRYTQVALKQAARDAKQAVQSEIQARKELEKAQQGVLETKQAVNNLTKEFTKIQTEEGKVTNEVEIIAESMVKRQERVRKAIRRKQIELEEERLKEAGEPVSYVKPVAEEENPDIIQEIERLRKEERFLAAEDSRRQEKIGRLLSRAAKLRARSEERSGSSAPQQIVEPPTVAQTVVPATTNGQTVTPATSNGQTVTPPMAEQTPVPPTTKPTPVPPTTEHTPQGASPSDFFVESNGKEQN